MTLGKGGVINISRKQKLNTKSSTHSELVGANDASTTILWAKLFVEHQGYEVKENVLFQDDDKSTILLEENGMKSAGKRSRALNIRYFFITDQVEKGNMTIKHCPRDVGQFPHQAASGREVSPFHSRNASIDNSQRDSYNGKYDQQNNHNGSCMEKDLSTTSNVISVVVRVDFLHSPKPQTVDEVQTSDNQSRKDIQCG